MNPSKSILPILIIDDHRMVTDGLEAILRNVGYKNISCANTELEIEKAIKGLSAVVILDINIGNVDGLQLLKKIKQEQNAKVLMLSSYADTRLIKEAMKSGCDGYISKHTASDHVVAAIDLVTDGRSYFDPTIQSIINASFAGMHPDTEVTKERQAISMLTQREREVLQLISEEYSSEEIANQLFISKSTVDTHRKNLIEKLKVKSSIGLMNYYSTNKTSNA